MKSGASRYHKISVIDAAMEQVFLHLYVASHKRAPRRIILDLDATDDPLHGRQEGRFFHGYYRCYCYLPLYIFDGRHLLVAKLRRADIDAAAGAKEEIARIVAHLRQAWPQVEIWLRADSGFAREELMSWCEENRVEYVFGLARNQRLEPMIPASWPRPRQPSSQRPSPPASSRSSTTVPGTAGHAAAAWWPRPSIWKGLQSALHCDITHHPADRRTGAVRDNLLSRGEMENRIKECQLDLYADRTSAATMRANQLRLWLASLAYVLVEAVRRLGLSGTEMANATAGSIRLKLLKIGAVVTVSVRRIKLAFASACPMKDLFTHALQPCASCTCHQTLPSGPDRHPPARG